MWNRLLSTNAPTAVIIVRVMVGLVFLSEGVQKFLFPDAVGAGRFAKLGLPQPEFLATFVGSFEILCGVLIVLGLLTRLAVIPTIIIMLVALTTTKAPIFAKEGFWKMAHEARTDWSMLLGSVFFLIVGAGLWSIDAWYSRRREGSTMRVKGPNSQGPSRQPVAKLAILLLGFLRPTGP